VVTTLQGWKLKQPAPGHEPQALPSMLDPNACATSSITARSCVGQLDHRGHRRRLAEGSTGMMARVTPSPCSWHRRGRARSDRARVHEHRYGTELHDDVARRREGEVGHEHLIAGQRTPPRREGNAVVADVVVTACSTPTAAAIWASGAATYGHSSAAPAAVASTSAATSS
jgi:hypothetical protein